MRQAGPAVDQVRRRGGAGLAATDGEKGAQEGKGARSARAGCKGRLQARALRSDSVQRRRRWRGLACASRANEASHCSGGRAASRTCKWLGWLGWLRACQEAVNTDTAAVGRAPPWASCHRCGLPSLNTAQSAPLRPPGQTRGCCAGEPGHGRAPAATAGAPAAAARAACAAAPPPGAAAAVCGGGAEGHGSTGVCVCWGAAQLAEDGMPCPPRQRPPGLVIQGYASICPRLYRCSGSTCRMWEIRSTASGDSWPWPTYCSRWGARRGGGGGGRRMGGAPRRRLRPRAPWARATHRFDELDLCV